MYKINVKTGEKTLQIIVGNPPLCLAQDKEKLANAR